MAIESHTQTRGDGHLVKDINTHTILELIQRSGPISRVEIARRTNISLATVCSIVQELTDQEYVLEAGIGEYTGGRRSPSYAFNPQAAYIIGIDLGGTKIAGGLTDLNGTILARKELPTPDPGPEQKPMAVLEQTIRLINELQALIPAPSGEKLRGIGLGVPGVVNMSSGVVTLAPALGWDNFPLRQLLAQEFSCHLYCDNDVNTILLGEQWMGAAKEASNAVCIAVGTGIGASIMINNQIYRGATNAAGEVGYMVTTLEALRHSYPGYGYLESLASGLGIASRAKRALEQTSNHSGPLAHAASEREVDAPMVMQCAALGDELALKVVDETVELLSAAIINAACLLNPEIVLLAGGVMKSADLLLPRIIRLVSRVSPYPPRLSLLSLGLDAGILGAVAGVIRSSQLSVTYSQLLSRSGVNG